MDTPMHLKGSDLPPRNKKESKAGIHTEIFSTGPRILRNYSITCLISKCSALGPTPASLEIGLPPLSSACPERSCFSIGLACTYVCMYRRMDEWMVPHRYQIPYCILNVMSLLCLYNHTQTFGLLCSQGRDIGNSKAGLASPAIIYFVPAIW